MSIIAIAKPVSTEDKLIEMLKEKTGMSFLDSGGTSGRNWQRNQKIDFDKIPIGKLEFWNCKGELDICATLSVYHWLLDRVDYNQGLDECYQEYCENNGEYLDLNSAQDFVHSLPGAAGIYGEDAPFSVNTYNGECLLSQTLQYVYWTDESGPHILLQIHGGCDVRGGYTYPVAFDLVGETCIFDNAKGTIYCDDCMVCWDTDNGYDWYADNDYADNFREYEATDEKPDYPEKINFNQPTLPIDLSERPKVNNRVVWVDEDQNGYCPFCGGLLKISN
jgi:hypothetical protein